LLPRVKLKGFFLCLPCMVAFMVTFPVVVINSHCQGIHVLEQGRFSLFPGRDKVLELIGEPLVIVMAQNTIFPT